MVLVVELRQVLLLVPELQVKDTRALPDLVQVDQEVEVQGLLV